MQSPQQFVENNIGKAYAWDGPKYGVQCVGGFKKWCSDEGVPIVACPNDYAESYWTCKNKAGQVVSGVYAWQTEYFTKITNWKDFKDGDWVIWPMGCQSHPMSHIAMYYQGKEFGQRQYEDNRAFCLKETNFTDAFGALRWKGYENLISIPYGYASMTINGHSYLVQRMYSADRITVLAKALNDVAPIEELDAPALISGKITGGNLFQMRDDLPDEPKNRTYGDISAPFNGVYQSLPNQDSTLFYDLTDGSFGDCTEHNIDPTHAVFSPTLVFPNSLGHWEYARVMGLQLKDVRSWYSFVIRLSDGYAIGIAKEQLTPQQIADDFGQTDMINIAFLDGGGSAQAGFWYNSRMNYEDPAKEHRKVPSAIAIYRPYSEDVPEQQEPAPAETEPQQDQEEEPQDEGEPTEMEKPQETAEIKPQEGWTDPEPQTNVIVARIAALLSVKSILTIALTAVFGYLVVNQIEVPEFFADIYKIVVLFFFGYQTGKLEPKNGK